MKREKLENLQAQAIKLFNNGQFNEAIQIYQQLLTEKSLSNVENIHYQLGRSFQELSKFKQASNAYLQALQINPKFIDASIGFGNVAIKVKSFAEAEKAYQYALLTSPERGEQIALLFENLGDELESDKQFELSIKAYQNALQLNKDINYQANISNKIKKIDHKIHQYLAEKERQHLLLQFSSTQLALQAEQDFNWEQAIYYWEIAIQENIQEKKYYNNLWSIFSHQNNLEKYAEYYKEKLVHSHQGSLYVILGGILSRQGHLLEALDAYQEAISLGFCPNWLYFLIISTLVDLGKLDQAEKDAYLFFNKSEQTKQLFESLAYIATRSYQFELALEYLEKLITISSNSLLFILEKINILKCLQRTQEAETILQQALLAYPNNIHIIQSLALLAIHQQDWETALSRYELCLELNNSEEAIVPLKLAKAKILINLKQWNKAKKIYNDIKNQFSQEPEALYGLAQVERFTGNLELCLEYAQQLITLFPGLNLGYQEAQQVYIELGQFDKATEMFLIYKKLSQREQTKQNIFLLPEGLKLPEVIGKNNDYSFIEEKLEEFVKRGQAYSLAVSIIIPVYNRKELLAKTLAAITHQTYPQELIEVVVADDGSSDRVEEVIEKYKNLLDLNYVYQPDEGFRLSAVRNLGMRAAKYDYFIILDCDVLPVPQLVESYMKFFHVYERVAMMGLRRFVCTDTISDDEILQNIDVVLSLPDIQSSSEYTDYRSASGITYDWRLPVFTETDYEKKQRWPFFSFVGANMVLSRAAFELVGGYDEEFRAWGCEDTEMGYRLYNTGYYFIPVKEAIVLHQEPPNGKNESDRPTGKSITQILLEEKCPVSWCRSYQKGRIYQVPKVSIYMPAYNAGKYIKEAIESALNQTYTDLEVCICDDGSTDNTLQILEQNYATNPRVRWITQPNGGTAKASNAAVNMCRGVYIGQLDADDILKPNAVELAVSYLDNYDVGFVYSSCEIIDGEGKFVSSFRHSETFSREGLLHTNIVGPFRFYRKRDWIRAGGFSENLITAEDYDLALKMAEVCDFYHLDNVNYLYRWHGENTSVVKRHQQISDHFLCINRALQRMGLHDWEAIPNNSNNNPRSVTLQKKLHILPEGLKLPEVVGKNNDYSFIEEKLEEFVKRGQAYSLAVSIIIPVYNRKELLAKTLAAITHQTYPQELIEVVVADDGSSDGIEEAIEKYKNLLDLNYVYQPDEGFRLSAVRNLGMRAAKYDYFIILDCDVLPVPQLVESYMKFFHVYEHVAMMGPIKFVCTDTISDSDILKNINSVLTLSDIKSESEFFATHADSQVTYDWRLPIFEKSNYEKTERWAFHTFAGGNVAHSKKSIEQVGGYDEEFRAWGCEDTEMGYRLYNAGYYFIPVMQALGLHQEPIDNKGKIDRKKGKSVTELLLEEKCPVPIFRTYQKGKVYQVPKVSIYMPAYNAGKYIKEAIESVLNQTYTDLEVCICDDGSTDNTLQILEQSYATNPRVRWITQPNGGTAKASNAAVNMCRGVYIGQLDADDILKPNAVELAVSYLDNYDVGFVYSSCEIIDGEGKFVSSFRHSETFSREGLLHTNIVGPFRFYRKRDWIRAGGFSEDLITAEDYDLALKMAEVCDFYHLDNVNYLYRWHGENTSVVKRHQQISDHFLCINRALQRMGLHDWEAIPNNSNNNPRSVTLQNKNLLDIFLENKQDTNWVEIIDYWTQIISTNASHPEAYYKRAYAQAALHQSNLAQIETNSYQKVTEMALSLPEFDQNVETPLIKYVICSTGRSGSFLLCRQLFNSNLGIPQEYFNAIHREIIGERINIDKEDHQSYLKFLLSNRTTSNRVWGTKLHYGQYIQYKEFLEQNLLDKNIKYIFLYRENIIAQAISYHLAFLTGRWGFDNLQTSYPRSIDLYDLEHIYKCYTEIVEQNTLWEQFFNEHNINPLRIKYEDFTKEQPKYIKQIVEYFGISELEYKICDSEEKQNEVDQQYTIERKTLITQFTKFLDKQQSEGNIVTSNFNEQTIDLSIIVLINNNIGLIKNILAILSKFQQINVEILLVDYNLTTIAIEQCQQYCELYDNVSLITKKEKLTNFTSLGGEFVYIFDIRDLVECSSLEKAVLLAKNTQYDLVLFRYLRSFENKATLGGMTAKDRSIWSKLELLNFSGDSLFISSQLTPYLSNSIVKTNLFQKNNIELEIAIHNNILFHWYSLIVANNVGYLDNFVCMYRRFTFEDKNSNAIFESLCSAYNIIKDCSNFKYFESQWSNFSIQLLDEVESHLSQQAKNIFNQKKISFLAQIKACHAK